MQVKMAAKSRISTPFFKTRWGGVVQGTPGRERSRAAGGQAAGFPVKYRAAGQLGGSSLGGGANFGHYR